MMITRKRFERSDQAKTTVGVLKPSKKLRGGWLVRSIDNECWLVVDADGLFEIPLDAPRAVTIELAQFGQMPRHRPVRIAALDTIADPHLMKLCFFSREEMLWRLAVEPYLQSLALEEKIAAILAKLSGPKGTFSAGCVLTLITDAELLHTEAAFLRKYVSHERRWGIVVEGIQLGIDEDQLTKLISEVPSDEESQFWSLRPRSTELDRILRPLRPAHIQLIEDFPEISEIGQPSFPKIYITVKHFLKNLDENDRKLAQTWMDSEPSSTNQDFVEAKMLSARMAEKVAASFLRQLKFRVKDISAEQLSDGQDWRTYDLLVDNKIPVDVKNARPPVNSQNAYVDYAVPRFKLARNNEQVRIMGVFSPYLFLDEFNKGEVDTSNRRNLPSEVTVLGTTQLQEVRRLETEFRTRVLRLRLISSLDNSSKNPGTNILPPWVFDYPDKYYESVNDKLRQIHGLSDEQIPDGSLIRATGTQAPIAPFLAAQRRPPDHWMADLHAWEINFIDHLLSFEKPSLPVIFLAILSHFTRMIKGRVLEEYEPLNYGKLINWGGYPLGRTDPLNLVAGLCQNLSTVWENRESIGLQEFSYFQYQGLGILRGARSEEERLTTLIAYCGGFVEGMGKCGNPNLVLGKDNIIACSSCGHLICPICGFCSVSCDEYAERRQTWDSDLSLASRHGGSNYSILTEINAWGIDEIARTDDDIPF